MACKACELLQLEAPFAQAARSFGLAWREHCNCEHAPRTTVRPSLPGSLTLDQRVEALVFILITLAMHQQVAGMFRPCRWRVAAGQIGFVQDAA